MGRSPNIKLGDEYLRQLRYSNCSYYVVIPAEVVRKFGWKKGEQLLISVNGDGITIKKASPCLRCEFYATCREKKEYVSDIERCIHRRIRTALRA